MQDEAPPAGAWASRGGKDGHSGGKGGKSVGGKGGERKGGGKYGGYGDFGGGGGGRFAGGGGKSWTKKGWDDGRKRGGEGKGVVAEGDDEASDGDDGWQGVSSRRSPAGGGSEQSPVVGSHERLTIPTHDGIPNLDVLYTGDPEDAAAFLASWPIARHVGLDLEYRPIFKKGVPPSRSALLQLSAGPKVLLFDLEAIRRKTPEPLPAGIAAFLESPEHTFYGMGLTGDVARLAFEFDCIVRGIDFLQSWPSFAPSGGLAGAANRYIGCDAKTKKSVTLSNWDLRPLTLEQLTYAAEDAYLSWAVADHFIRREGLVDEEQLISMAAMYSAGRALRVPGVGVPSSRHDWEDAAAESAAMDAARAAKRNLRREDRRR